MVSSGRPHVFHEIYEILAYNPRDHLPINGNVKILGVYIPRNQEYFLFPCNSNGVQEPQKPPVRLDMSVIETCPTEGSIILVYGEINFDKRSKPPSVAVKFYDQINASDVKTLVEVNKFFRLYVAVEVINAPELFEELLCSDTDSD